MVNIFSNIAGAAHTFAAWVEKEWTIVYKVAPGIEQILSATLKYAGPALQTIVTVEAGGPAGVLVGKVISEAQSGLIAASSLVYDFGATPTVGGVIASVQNNLSTLLTESHITNPASVNVVTKVVSELAALVAALTPKTVTA